MEEQIHPQSEPIVLGDMDGDVFGIELPGELTSALDFSRLTEVTAEDLIMELTANTLASCPTLRERAQVRTSPVMRKLFDERSLDERKQLLNDEYLESLAALASLPSVGGRTEIPAGLCPQNWNGNRYQGTACINLQMRMLAHPGWPPVFLTSDQVTRLGLARKEDATVNSVVHKAGESGKSFRRVAWNVADLDMSRQYPRHYAEMQSFFSGLSGLPMTREGRELVAADGGQRPLEDIVRDMVKATDADGRRPRFNASSLSERERTALKNLAEDLATMTLCTRMRAPSHVRLGSVMTLSMRSFSMRYPFYEVMKYAGKISLDLGRELGVSFRRSASMDTLTARVNREMLREMQAGRSQGVRM